MRIVGFVQKLMKPLHMKYFNYLSKISLILSCLLCHLSHQAQTSISGTILNQDKKPIEFANIALMDIENHQLITGTISDENGIFQISTSKSGRYELSIQFIGYEHWTSPISTDSSIDLKEIILLERTNELSEVVVISSRPMIEKKEDKLVFNISSSPLKSGYDGLEVLEQSPNVWVDNQGNISMRNEAARILINGRQLNLSGEDLANYIKNLPSDHIKSVEVQSTPSASADAENSGGIINIILRKKAVGVNSILKAHYETFGESYHENYAGFNLNYGAEKWNIYSSYNFRERDNTAAVTSDIVYHNSGNYLKTHVLDIHQRKTHTYQLGFVLNPWKNHEFGAEFFGNTRTSFIHLQSNLALSHQQDTIDYGITNFIHDNHRITNNGVLNYAWKIDTLGSQFKLVGDYSHQINKNDNRANSAYQLGEFEDNQQRYDFDNQTTITAMQADLLKKTKTGLNLNIGLKYTHTKRANNLLAEDLLDGLWVENNQTTALNYQEQISAAYATLSKKIAEKHFIKAGVRVENTDLNRVDVLKLDNIAKNYTDWFPSIFYSYDMTNNTSISANYSRRLSRPAFRELNNDVFKVNDFRYAIGNPDLRPEYIDRYSISFQRKKHNASIYYHQYNDAINGIYFLEDGIAYYQRQNNGAQKQWGTQYNISGNIQNWWSVRGSVHLFYRKYTTDAEEDLFKKASYDLRLNQTFQVNETASIDLSGRYLSDYADAYYLQDDFYYVSLIFKKSFLDKKLNIRIYIDDIFNTARSSNTRPFDDFVTTQYRKERTRSIKLWLTYTFATKYKTNNRKNKSENESRSRM